MAKFIEKAVRKVRSSSPKRKTISTQHLDHEVFNNNTKAMSFPRSTIASSAPRLEIEKRLSVIDNQVHQMKGHHRRNSSYGGHQTQRKAETENRDENETDDLIAVTKQKINKENEEKQKEDDNIRHQLRKLTEQQTIEQTNIDQLRQDFLKLAPNKVQKPRIDAAYEKQKQKIKEKIASLERKKQTLEQKLSSNRSSEQLKMSENGSDYSFNQNSRNNSASGVTWSDDHQSETLASQNAVLHDSNLSLSKTTKSYSNQSLSDIKSTNSSKDDGLHTGHSSQVENAIEKQKEYLDEKMDKLKDYVDEQMNIMQREVQDCLRKVEQTQTDMKQEFDSIHEKIVKMVTDYDTSHELRAAEIRNLQNSFEEEISMVKYGSKSRHDELVDLIEKLSQKQDEIEMRQKYRIASEQQKDGSIIPEKSLQTLFDILLHAAGIVLLMISSLQSLLSPLTRTWSRSICSLLVLILSSVLYRYLRS